MMRLASLEKLQLQLLSLCEEQRINTARSPELSNEISSIEKMVDINCVGFLAKDFENLLRRHGVG